MGSAHGLGVSVLSTIRLGGGVRNAKSPKETNANPTIAKSIFKKID